MGRSLASTVLKTSVGTGNAQSSWFEVMTDFNQIFCPKMAPFEQFRTSIYRVSTAKDQKPVAMNY